MEFRQATQEIYRLSSLIKLQLNPFNEIDKNILVILDEFEHSFQNPTDFRWGVTHYLLIAHAQYLLKAEWEKVKWENAGFFRKQFLWIKSKLHAHRYRKFAKADGAIR